MSVKTCTKCGVEKELEEYSRRKGYKDGRRSYCKECDNDYGRAYREAHREERRAYNRAHYEANREEKKAYARAHYEANREEKKAYARDYHSLLGEPTVEKWQEISKKYATRSGRWSEAEDNYLTSSTERVIDDALALQRTYQAVRGHIQYLHRQGITLARDRVKEPA